MIPQSKPLPGTPLNWAHPLNRGLLAYWPMWERAGSATYDATRLIRGVLTNIAQSSTSGWTSGRDGGGAMLFDGADDYITVAGLPDACFTGNYTQTFWLRTTTNSNLVIVEKGNNNAFIQSLSGGALRVGALTTVLDAGTGFNDGRWHMCTVTFRVSDLLITLYKDGAFVASLTSGFAANSNSSPYVIGSRSGTVAWPGMIDDLRIYRRVLAPSEVWQLYARPYDMFVPLRVPGWFVPTPLPPLVKTSTLVLDAVKRSSYF